MRGMMRILLVALVVLVALSLRLRAVSLLPIDYDEDDYLRAAGQYAAALQRGDWAAFTQLNYRTEHPPLVKIVTGVAIAPLPPMPDVPDRPTTAPPASALPQPQFLVVRLVNGAFGVLEVLALALLNPLAGLFLAVNTWTIKYTSQVMLEALPSLTSALAILTYSKSNGRWNRWLAMSGVALGLTAASKYLYCVVGIAIVIHWLWKRREPAREDLPRDASFGGPMAWGLLALVIFFAADPYLWPDPFNRLKDSILYHAAYTTSQGVQQAGFPEWQVLVWLSGPVPWHPGVFVVSLDLLFTLLALFGFPRLWQKNSLYVIWFGVAFVFLLLWPTRWPQYILVLTFPLSLAAAEGFTALVGEPVTRWYRRIRAQGIASRRPRVDWGDTRRALIWLSPGTLALGLIVVYPLLFQSAMSLTDFSSLSIRDGLSGGVWREVARGLTFQVDPVVVSISPNGQVTIRVQQQDRGEWHLVGIQESSLSTKDVHYAGPGLYSDLLVQVAPTLLGFECIWTVLTLGLQTALGLGVALALNRAGVRLRRFWRAVYILPWAIPEFVGALIWFNAFDPQHGWIGFALGQPIPWQQDPLLALIVMALGALWLGWPVMMLAASAGLALVPVDVYDAANVDGATRWEQFRFITLPLLWPLLAPALIIRAIFSFNQFYLFYVMGAPWPVITFSTLSFYLFNTNGRFGGLFALSAAINVLTVVLLIVLIIWFDRRTRASEGVTYA